MGFLRSLVILYMLLYLTLYFGVVGAVIYVRSLIESNYNAQREMYGHIEYR